MLFPTTIVGSFPQPDWLIDRAKLAGRFPPRVRAKELWRVAEPYLKQAWEDATLIAIRAQEEAGLDIVSDGEIRRESYSNRFATALDGIDLDNPGTGLDRSGHPNPVPRIVGRIRRRHAVEVEDLLFLRRHTSRQIKITVPGPFTMLQQAQNDFYANEEEAAMDYAAALNEEIADLFAAGADVVQIDEPYMQARPEKARRYGVAALNRALTRPAGCWPLRPWRAACRRPPRAAGTSCRSPAPGSHAPWPRRATRGGCGRPRPGASRRSGPTGRCNRP